MAAADGEGGMLSIATVKARRVELVVVGIDQLQDCEGCRIRQLSVLYAKIEGCDYEARVSGEVPPYPRNDHLKYKLHTPQQG